VLVVHVDEVEVVVIAKWEPLLDSGAVEYGVVQVEAPIAGKRQRGHAPIGRQVAHAGRFPAQGLPGLIPEEAGGARSVEG
jgi:hypothetical protein